MSRTAEYHPSSTLLTGVRRVRLLGLSTIASAGGLASPELFASTDVVGVNERRRVL
jgi:hypothetical protein